jgi:hypothetical protein
MSLNVALQSVAFYVLSCSTCAKINHRRKAKVQAKRERAEKHELETEQPGLYRHPSPFATNPYWTEEIMMGPGPPKNKDKGGSKNASQRALNTAGQGSSYAGSTAMSSDPPSSPTAVTEGSRISGEGWNRKRYQREDEPLWGLDFPGQRIMDAIAKAGSSAGRLLEGRLSKSGGKEEENPAAYYLGRNPPVNDLHPPVVSTAPSSRGETRWMLQPPPSAKVMEGKERANRSRAGSNGSSRKGGDGTPLSRQITERLVDAKLQRGETPSHLEGRSLSSRAGDRLKTPTSSQSQAQGHDRSRSPSAESSGSSESVIRRKRKPPPISVSSSARSSRDTIEHIPIPSNLPPPSLARTTEMREQPARPALSTIVSSSNIVPQTKGDVGVQPLRELSTNSAANIRDPSPSQRLSPNANAMPATIPSVESKFPEASTFRFPRSATENTDPGNGSA